MRERNNVRKHRLTHKAALLAAALGVLVLPGCAGDVPIPFLDSGLPPAPPGPPPPYPSVATPVSDPEQKPPLLSEADQKKMETQLDQLAAEREASVKKRILRNAN